MIENDKIIREYIDTYKKMDWTRPCDEMVRLREMLDAAGIGWHDQLAIVSARNRCIWDTTSDMMVKVVDGERACEVRAFTVKWGLFSYGGADGRLEAKTFDRACVGNLDAAGAYELCMGAIDRARKMEARG
jgi:hypothetical protein